MWCHKNASSCVPRWLCLWGRLYHFLFVFSYDFWTAIVKSRICMVIGVCEVSEQLCESSLKWWRSHIHTSSHSINSYWMTEPGRMKTVDSIAASLFLWNWLSWQIVLDNKIQKSILILRRGALSRNQLPANHIAAVPWGSSSRSAYAQFSGPFPSNAELGGGH